MCRPSQTPHLTKSSARIDPPKRVLGLKEGVVTPPPIHGSDESQAQQGLLSPLILPGPFPWLWFRWIVDRDSGNLSDSPCPYQF
ncbi:unnamed protein product [Brassica rapa subsp. narinosa]